ncbi:hypothetical protein [Prevotella multiformis]|uniref:hypothetical protein n=1 Tax=Prevotella multiformis TaxID=282402 RepID=UPI0028DCCED4|nr:hypothetical protein [Prevotella multiformis]
MINPIFYIISSLRFLFRNKPHSTPPCRASLFSAKTMQASAKKACFQFAERSLFSAKIMQASAKKTCFQFAERSLFSANVAKFK